MFEASMTGWLAGACGVSEGPIVSLLFMFSDIALLESFLAINIITLNSN